MEEKNEIQVPPKITDRDRDKSSIINKEELRKQLTKPQVAKNTNSIQMNKTEDKNEIRNPMETKMDIDSTNLKETTRNFVCDHCKLCDGFERISTIATACATCGCELIYHLYDAEEDPNEDADEWKDENEDENSDGNGSEDEYEEFEEED